MLLAQCTTNAARKIHFHNLLHLSVLDARNDLNAIDRTENNTCLASGAAVLVDNR